MSVDVSDALYLLGEGRYAVFEPLGEGGSATVHRALDTQLGAERAIKLRRVPADARQSDAVLRLVDEARVMARVAHRHILPVHDVGWDRGWQFVVMHLAAGGSVDARVADTGPYPARQAVDLMLPVLDALQAAHDAGVLHRDLKPHNILLDAEGTPLLADWGIARLDDREATLTRTGVAMGTFAYMAPEQRLDAHDVGPTADVYAAGATLYHLLTAGSPVDLFHAAPASPRWEGVPEALRGILQRACAHDPAARPASPAALADLLRGCREVLPDVVSAVPAVGAELGGGTVGGGTVGGGTVAGEDPKPETPADAAPVARRRSWLGGLAVLGTGALAAVGLVALALVWGSAPPEVVIRTPEGDAARPAEGRAQTPEVAGPTPGGSSAPAEDPGAAGAAAPRDVGPEGSTRAPTPSETSRPATDVAPVDAPSPPLEGPPLPVHGTWQGSLEGRVALLEIAGPSSDLRLNLRVGGQEHRGRGRFDAPSGLLRATLDGEGGGEGGWELRLSGDRLRGTQALEDSTDVRGASFRRL